MAGVEAKGQELQGMSAVGVDIESVKNQLEEHKVRAPPYSEAFWIRVYTYNLQLVC